LIFSKNQILVFCHKTKADLVLFFCYFIDFSLWSLLFPFSAYFGFNLIFFFFSFLRWNLKMLILDLFFLSNRSAQYYKLPSMYCFRNTPHLHVLSFHFIWFKILLFSLVMSSLPHALFRGMLFNFQINGFFF